MSKFLVLFVLLYTGCQKLGQPSTSHVQSPYKSTKKELIVFFDSDETLVRHHGEDIDRLETDVPWNEAMKELRAQVTSGRYDETIQFLHMLNQNAKVYIITHASKSIALLTQQELYSKAGIGMHQIYSVNESKTKAMSRILKQAKVASGSKIPLLGKPSKHLVVVIGNHTRHDIKAGLRLAEQNILHPSQLMLIQTQFSYQKTWEEENALVHNNLKTLREQFDDLLTSHAQQKPKKVTYLSIDGATLTEKSCQSLTGS